MDNVEKTEHQYYLHWSESHTIVLLKKQTPEFKKIVYGSNFGAALAPLSVVYTLRTKLGSQYDFVAHV